MRPGEKGRPRLSVEPNELIVHLAQDLAAAGGMYLGAGHQSGGHALAFIAAKGFALRGPCRRGYSPRNKGRWQSSIQTGRITTCKGDRRLCNRFRPSFNKTVSRRSRNVKTSILLLLLVVSWLSCRGAEFSLLVAGREVPVIEHRVRGRLNCAYAHFTASNAVPVEVRVASGVRGWSLSPANHRLTATADGIALRFTLPSPLYLVLAVNGTRLLLLADPPEEPLPAAKVIVVTRAPYSADASGARDATASLQRALDEAGALGGGATVLFPPGIYTTTGVRVRSHTRLHLPAGAVLQGSARAEDYPEFHTKPGRTGISALLRVEDAEDVRIFGHGTLDARGFALAGDATTIEEVRLKARCLTVERSSRVTVEGLLCRESTSWSVPFFHSTDVVARRIKVINDLGPLEHSDGINLCAVRNGIVEDCLVHTTDDAFCAKGHAGGPSENLVFRRLVALSATRGLKCGLQAYEPMRNVLFEQVDIVRTRDGIDLMHWDGAGEWSDIVFRDVRVEQCERRSITATVREGGGIRRVRFERILFAQERPGFLRAKDAASRIEGVTFSNVFMGGKRVTGLAASGIQANPFTAGIVFLEP